MFGDCWCWGLWWLLCWGFLYWLLCVVFEVVCVFFWLGFWCFVVGLWGRCFGGVIVWFLSLALLGWLVGGVDVCGVVL